MGDEMRRWLAVILCICLLPIPVGAKTETKYIALTFDDGPSGRFTRRLLEGLESRGVRATFLLCGYRIKIYPELTKQICDAGHEIGLHGYSHNNMSKMTPAQLRQELKDTLRLLPKSCQVNFLRPPGGQCNAAVSQVAKQFDLSLLLWSVDPKDWENHDAKAVQTAVVSNVKNADVILLHDMSDSSVDAALAIVDTLLAQGYRFVTASELSRMQGKTLLPGAEYKHFR